jgi:hypothetical protein
MPVNYTVAGAIVSNTANIYDAPAVQLLANNIVFTNTERGRISSSSDDFAALVITGQGVRVVNELNGIINSFDFNLTGLGITGSAFADSIDNFGGIYGKVLLGTASGALTDNGGQVNSVLPNVWKIQDAADFNGDGFTDVLWRNDNGQLSQWLGSASGRLIDNGAVVNQFVPQRGRSQGQATSTATGAPISSGAMTAGS